MKEKKNTNYQRKYSKKIAKKVISVIAQSYNSYNYDEELGCVSFVTVLHTEHKKIKADMMVIFYEDHYLVRAWPYSAWKQGRDLTVIEKRNRPLVAEFICRANEVFDTCSLGMNFNNGTFYCSHTVDCKDNLPSKKQIRTSLNEPLITLLPIAMYIDTISSETYSSMAIALTKIKEHEFFGPEQIKSAFFERWFKISIWGDDSAKQEKSHLKEPMKYFIDTSKYSRYDSSDKDKGTAKEDAANNDAANKDTAKDDSASEGGTTGSKATGNDAAGNDAAGSDAAGSENDGGKTGE